MTRRIIVVVAAVSLAVIIGVTGGLAVSTAMSFSATNDALRSDVDTLQAQLEAEGIEPAVPADDGEAAVVAVDGEDGRDGRDGRDGTDGTDGESIVGPPGPPGETVVGPKGDDGEPIVGPPGPPGESIIGQTGEAGPQGPQGPTGEEGEDVRTFSFVAGGARYTCTDPDGDGAFECTQEAVP